MGNCELGKCDFCGEEKSLARKYIHCKNKHFDDNKKGCYFAMIRYCSNCGIEDDTRDVSINEEEILSDIRDNGLYDGAEQVLRNHLSNMIKFFKDEIVKEIEDQYFGDVFNGEEVKSIIIKIIKEK